MATKKEELFILGFAFWDQYHHVTKNKTIYKHRKTVKAPKSPCSQRMKVSCRPNFDGSSSPWNNSERHNNELPQADQTLMKH